MHQQATQLQGSLTHCKRQRPDQRQMAAQIFGRTSPESVSRASQDGGRPCGDSHSLDGDEDSSQTSSEESSADGLDDLPSRTASARFSTVPKRRSVRVRPVLPL